MVHSLDENLSNLEKHLKEYKKEIWIETNDNYYGTEVVKTSPLGAKILLELYNNGFFNQYIKRKAGKGIDVSIVAEYIDSEESINEIYNEKINSLLRKEIVIEDTSMITEADFCYETLNRIFINTIGLKQGIYGLTLAGIEVTKSVRTYSSNSGKSTSSDIDISWTGSDGQRHCEGKGSIYSDNRRNSEDRNWGLPE